MPKAYCLFNPEVEGLFGGSEVDLYYLSTELAKDPNYQVSFIVADYGQPAIEERENVTLIKSLNPSQNPLTGARKIWNALKQADAHIYMTKTPSPGVPLIAWFCRKHKRSFIYRTASSTECDGTYRRNHPVLGRIFTWSLKRAKYVFTQNEKDSENLSDIEGMTAKVIHNGHRMPKVTPQSRETILWVGRSAPVKQPYKFLELARHFPQEHFTMICPQATGDSQYQQLRAQADEISNVKFISHVPFHQMDAQFMRAKVLINTSDTEGFPNSFIQAGSCAVPVLSLNANPDDFLNQYKCGFCADGNWDAFMILAEKIVDPSQFQSHGQHAKQYAMESHDIESTVRQYKLLLK